MFWPLFWTNCSSDLKNFTNSQPSASNFKSFSQSLEHFFLTVGQYNFGNKIPFLPNNQKCWKRIFFSCFDRQKLFCSLILCDIIIISGESRFESGGANPFAIFFPSSKHLVRSSCFVVATFVYLINKLANKYKIIKNKHGVFNHYEYYVTFKMGM